MALAAVKTFIAGEVLYAADVNALNTNILNNALSLISPLTGNLDVNGKILTAIDEATFSNAAANATAAGRLRRNGVSLTWHNGTSASPIFDGWSGVLRSQIFS